MNVIALLNKRKNNEKLPKKIRIRNMDFYLANGYENYNVNYIYETENEVYWLDAAGINTEIEIIEEDKEIEDLKGGDFSDHEMLKQVVGKVRQLISEVNELKKGK
jgi:hypothetical protein